MAPGRPPWPPRSQAQGAAVHGRPSGTAAGGPGTPAAAPLPRPGSAASRPAPPAEVGGRPAGGPPSGRVLGRPLEPPGGDRRASARPRGDGREAPLARRRLHTRADTGVHGIGALPHGHARHTRLGGRMAQPLHRQPPLGAARLPRRPLAAPTVHTGGLRPRGPWPAGQPIPPLAPVLRPPGLGTMGAAGARRLKRAGAPPAYSSGAVGPHQGREGDTGPTAPVVPAQSVGGGARQLLAPRRPPRRRVPAPASGPPGPRPSTAGGWEALPSPAPCRSPRGRSAPIPAACRLQSRGSPTTATTSTVGAPAP